MIRKIFNMVLMFSLQLSANNHEMKLQKALDQNLVKAEVKSLGGYQGYCILLTLKNLGKDSLRIILEPGRRLNSVDDKNQDILVTKEEIIVLQKFENRSINVKGYCCQASNFSPSTGAKYEINKMADPSLVSLAQYLNAFF